MDEMRRQVNLSEDWEPRFTEQIQLASDENEDFEASSSPECYIRGTYYDSNGANNQMLAINKTQSSSHFEMQRTFNLFPVQCQQWKIKKKAKVIKFLAVLGQLTSDSSISPRILSNMFQKLPPLQGTP